MKNFFLFILCGIGITATKQYGNNSTLLESKIRDGEGLPHHLSWLLKNLVSIQIDNEHTWTGSIFNEDTIIATAECADDLFRYNMRNARSPEPVFPKVCYGGPLTQTEYTCISVVVMNTQREFQFASVPYRLYSYEKPFLPYNYALLRTDQPIDRRFFSRTDFPVIAELYDEEVLYVAGFETNPAVNSRARPVKSVRIQIINSAECAQMYNREPNNFPPTTLIRCFRTIPNGASLDKGDRGSPVFKGDTFIGIVSKIDDGQGPGILVLPKKLGGSWNMCSLVPLTSILTS